jgi:cytidylate kinase
MIITIDGPAGAGKSTVARRLARKLGYQFLDTGATYRAVALKALRQQEDWNQPERLAHLAGETQVELAADRVLLDGDDVTDEIRTSAVTEVTHYVADNPGVREQMVRLQRRLAEGQRVVTEGRDQGTVVFPDADYKIYLTASPQERARRRMVELNGRGESVTLAEVLARIQQRDARDSRRTVGPLKPAADAIELFTDGMSIDEVVNRIERIVSGRGG